MGKNTEDKKTSTIKIKKKRWFKIISPSLFGKKEMGESYLGNAEEAVGRTLKINLKDLSGNVKDQNAYVNFVIERTEGSNLMASTTGYQLSNSYVKRAVRKSTSRIDDYFVLKTKDDKNVIVKTLIVTFNKAQRGVCTAISKELGRTLRSEAGKADFETFISQVVTYRLQSALKKKLSKIYPLKEIALRVVKLSNKVVAAQKVEISEEEPVEQAGEEAVAAEETAEGSSNEDDGEDESTEEQDQEEQ